MLPQMRSRKNPKMALEDEQQVKTIKTSHSSSESVPTEIIVEILSRLPVESLLRCKSVCKSWRSLISDPYFIKYHLTLSTTGSHQAHHKFLVRSSDVLKTCPLFDVMRDHNIVNPVELDYPMKDHCVTVSIVGCCNGLICIIINRRSLFIWNPSTRKSIQLPDHQRSDGIVGHGFGCNKSADDYIVVEITCSSEDRYDNMVLIYSSKNGNWKKIGGFPHWIWIHNMGVFLNGALHWIASQDYGSWIIVSLDLTKETYGEVVPPVDEENGIDLKMGILGDCLCVLCDYSNHSRFCADVWVMKVYGVKDSWFKLVSIPYDLGIICPEFYSGEQFRPPLCVSNDEKVLLRFEFSLIVFDSKDGSAFEIENFNGCYEAYTFVESLVSPAGHGNLV